VIPAPLLALARAAAAGRPVLLSYREAGAALARQEVEVLSLGWRFGQWVALARQREGGGLRVLELGRVEAVRPVERRRRPRGHGHGHGHGARPRRPREVAPSGVDPLDFALADLQDPDAGPARRVTVALPRALASLAGTLFAGAEVEALPGGARVHLEATNGAALAQMVASLGVALG
jgi:predicted DNA-binding transcriptional regulator YafY